MEINFEYLTTIASGLAFAVVTTLGFYAKYKTDGSQKETKAIEARVESASNLGPAVRALAIEIAELRANQDELMLEKRVMEEQNRNLRERIVEVENIMQEKYPAALAALREYRRLHPHSNVAIPDIIASDL
nr:MAG TPA: hypothetical protein [Caudoviricetes sp.]